MYAVTRLIRFCYGHRLLNYRGKCRHLHGHNGRAEITLSSNALDARGMVRDFEEIKQTLQAWIDQTLDHTMLLSKDDPMVEVLRARAERCFVLETNPTAEAIAKLIFDHAVSCRLPVSTVTLWETDQSFATYRPAAARTRPRSTRPARRMRAVRSTSTAA